MTAASGRDPAPGRRAAPVWADGDPAELLRRSGSGDEAAFAQLYDLTSGRLFGLVLRVVRDVSLSEEVTQQVYLHLWRHSAQFDPDRGSALGWILGIAHQSALDRVGWAGRPPISSPSRW